MPAEDPSHLPAVSPNGAAGDSAGRATRVDVPPVASAPAAAQAGHSQQMPTDLTGMLRLVHRALRGRYILTVILALAGATGGAYAALKLRPGRPVYRSEGLLRIAYTLPEVIGETDQNAPMAMFDTFMASQKTLIHSRRVLDLAVQDPVWRNMGQRLPDKPDAYYAENLGIEIQPRSEFIKISVTDDDPGRAHAAVTAVINAYMQYYREFEREKQAARAGVLDDELNFLAKRVKEVTDQVRDRSREFGTSNLDLQYATVATRVANLDAALDEVRMALAVVPPGGVAPTPVPSTRPSTTGTGSQGDVEPEAMTVEQIAAVDPEMRGYVDLRARAGADLQRLLDFGYGEAHKSVHAARYALNQANERIAKHAETFRAYRSITGQNLSGPRVAAVATAGKTAEELRLDEQRLKQLRAEVKAEMLDIGNKRLEMQRLDGELTSLKANHEQLERRANLLRTEAAMGGRLSPVSSAQIPLSPIRDPRLKMVAAGSMAGFCLPVAAMIGLGLLRRRYEYSDEPESDVARHMPLLGILPELDGADEERRAAAAHCVHQIRVLLRTKAAKRKSSVYLVTSATAGEGKTSLTISLGLSFAAAGVRTLVVDGDVVGRHLTAAFGAAKLPGLRDALEQGTIKKLVHRAHNGLGVLTAGAVQASDASALPAAGIADVIAEARHHFEVVLVDTGPILGSIEAAVLAPEVDAAILAISRGQDRGLVRTALERLWTLGVSPAGFVYNRARPRDFASSPFGSSAQSVLASAPLGEDELAAGHAGERVARTQLTLTGGSPLVQAVGSGPVDVSRN